ncbi:hypothetical protein JW710_04145 [Candidatus Dojkabacteria bacterium]|nr:hypothetical protein [Candidatus Dojkabacteria bacterium]
MSGCIKAFRWTISVFLILLIIPTITIGVPLVSVSTYLANRETPKRWLKEIELYDNALDIALDVLEKQKEGSYFIDLKDRIDDEDSDVSEAVHRLADPDFLEESIETVIDAYYDWFEGETDKPEYSIPIAEDKETLVVLLSAGFKEKVRGLPVCEEGFVITDDFNPIETECQPEGYDFDEITRYLEDNADSDEFEELLSKANISSDEIELSDETTEQAQLLYNKIKIYPIIFLSGTIILVLLLILLIPGVKTSFMTTGIVLIVSSVFTTITGLIIKIIINFGSQKGLDEIKDKNYEELEKILGELIRVVSADITRRTLLIALTILVIGVLLTIIGAVIKKKKDNAGEDSTKPSKSEEKKADKS